VKSWKVIAGVAVVGGLTVATVALMSAGRNRNLTAEFADLTAEIEAVHDAFARAAHSDPGGVAPGRDPRLKVLHRMDRLADAAAGRPEGAYIASETFAWSYMLDLDLEHLPDRFARLTEHYADSSEITAPLEVLPDVAISSGKPDAWIRLLEAFLERTKNPSARLAAWYAKGQIQMQTGAQEAAKVTFEHLVAAEPDSDSAEFARRAIFEIDHLQVGKVAPDFTARTLDGDEVSLESLRGNVVLLDFWATWCPSCISEIPRLKEISAKLDGKPFRVLAVSLDDTRSSLTMLLNALDPPGIQTWDEAGRKNPVALMYNAQVLPTWYLIDADGVIRARDPFGDKLLPAIRALLPPAGADAGQIGRDANAG
jgi:thiol-disulfide isomerase/thioredoxin